MATCKQCGQEHYRSGDSTRWCPKTYEGADEGKLKSMLHWLSLAKEAEEWAVYLGERGEYAEVYRRKAKTYSRTAESIRLEIETGEYHCTVCLGAHSNQDCPQRPRAGR